MKSEFIEVNTEERKPIAFRDIRNGEIAFKQEISETVMILTQEGILRSGVPFGRFSMSDYKEYWQPIYEDEVIQITF